VQQKGRDDIMKSAGDYIGQKTLVTVLTFTCLGLLSSVAVAQRNTAPERQFENFDRNNFDPAQPVDNRWFPLKPGMQYVYKGSQQEEGKRIPHRVGFAVTDLTKVIDGVRATVVWETDTQDGLLIESELAFFAQDKDGNVWQLGELVETYDEDGFVGGKTWLSGNAGARAGIAMPGKLQLGASYSQGYAPAPINWADYGKVDRMGHKTCVRVGCYNDVLVIAESSDKEGPEAEQLKYYAPGIGFVQVGWRGKRERTRETLELTEVKQLDAEGMAKVRAAALAIESRAYDYGRTPPLETMNGERVQSQSNPAPDVSTVGAVLNESADDKPFVAQISEDRAREIALKRMPGEATAVTIERKRGKNVYVVEIQTSRGERDVLVDPQSGEIVGTE
jgi:uncharacterized membrane protein YkoI